MTAYYNEIDPHAAQWLRNLIRANLIAPGVVDERPIQDVKPYELAPFTQCHFFAGIGGWSYALRLAGWPDHRPVWTGSCPCQPFSLAGKRGGFADDRHLWPYWRYLIAQRRPARVFGEQVASAGEWLRLVRGDLEAMDYAVGAIPMEAASTGADHLRDRYWFVADGAQQLHDGTGSAGATGRLEHSNGSSVGHARGERLALRSIAEVERGDLRQERSTAPTPGVGGFAMAHPHLDGSGDGQLQRGGQLGRPGGDQEARGGGNRGLTDGAGQFAGRAPFETARHGNPAHAADRQFDWVIGADGKARRVESDIRMLADALPAFLVGLRAEYFAEAAEKVIGHGQKTAVGPGEVLRAVWQTVLSEPEAMWEIGEPSGVRGAEILLPFLRELGQRAAEESDGAFPSAAEFETAMRSLRFNGEASRASLRWGYTEQHPLQYPDALHALSWFLAQHARTAWEAHKRQNAEAIRLLAVGMPGRIQQLRGFGNAIDPVCAATFIRACMTK